MTTEPLGCTGISARWCPIHGDCVCPEIPGSGGEIDMNSDACPLHSFSSRHGEDVVIQTAWGPIVIGEIS
jgi:hypothetical protein